MNRLFFLIFTALLLVTSGASAQCPETIAFDSVSYPVPAQWRGLCIDSSRLADPAHLVKLPANLCFEDYRIFVTPDTRTALVALAAAARQDSVSFKAKSGYRSHDFQKKLLSRRMAKGLSFAEACRYVAPPGFSEHQTGTALDLAVSSGTFANSSAYRWLQANADRFGFVETYPNDSLSNLPWEPWHWCYNPEVANKQTGPKAASASSPD